MWIRTLVLLTVLLAAACGYNDGGTDAATAEPWLAADALFLTEPAWLGGDGAVSVDLGGDRTLWLFGLSYVDPEETGDRRRATLVANTAAIQTGRDPATASIRFFWGDAAGEPAALFPGGLAPRSGMLRDGVLTLFFTRPDGTHVALRVDDPSGEPDAWTVEEIEVPANAALFATSVVFRDGFVYAYALGREPEFPVFVARWTAADFDAGRLDALAWWDGRAFAPGATPQPLFDQGTGSANVTVDAARDRFVHVQSRGVNAGFLADAVALRVADRPESGWGRLGTFYRPPEAQAEGVFANSGRAHPQLTGADLVATYVPNATDDARRLDDPALLYPRFLRIRYR